MRLLEREPALASLHEYLESAASGDGRFVLVSGEAGVGKSTLLEHFESATPQLRWLHGACDGLFTPRPLGPLFDIAEQAGGELLAACRRDASREQLFRQLLSTLADGAPRVVAVEDVHWADESTLDLLRFLGRRVRDTGALVICTYRDDEIGPDHPLRLVLGELGSSRSVRRVNLAPLSEHAVRELAVDSEVDARELYRLSGGNPFFVTEVLQARSTELPESARDAVLARLARLAPAVRRVAEAAALLGTHVEARLLGAVAAPAAEDLDALVASGLMVSDRDGLRFRHELSRLAVERGVPAHRRTQAHGLALAALQEMGSDDEARLAYHAEGAGDAAAVLRFAPAAAAHASSLGAHREAAAQYERALRFADHRDRAAVAELCELLVSENSLTDAWDRAAEAGEQALALWRQVGDRYREGAMLSQLSQARWRLCRPAAETQAYAHDAVAVLEPLGPSPELAWAYAIEAKAVLMTSSEQRDRVLALAHRAQQLATEFDLAGPLSDALITEGCAVADHGVDWRAVMQRALDVALAADVHYQVGRAYGNMVEYLAERRRFVECQHLLAQGTQYCDEHDLGTHGYLLRALGAGILVAQGRWDAAMHVVRPLIASRMSRPNRTHLAINAGRVLARRGATGAWTYLDEAVANAARSGYAYWIVKAYPAHAEAHWLAGDLDVARADLAVAVDRIAGASLATAASIATWCRRLGMDVPQVAPEPDDPAADLLAGEYAAAADGWDALGMPYEAALALFDAGGEDGLREAIRRFEALGASAAVEATRREMRRRGLRSVPAGARASTRAHPLGLTRRESEVLAGICAGRTNAEISAQLFLSPRTVDHHVSAVLAKLGVSSRSEAAAEAARRGLVGSQN
jgi:DNA-binding CsgD family transcriptional regulator